VKSYFGLRGIELRDGKFLINGSSVYLQMILDQGYWPQSYLTAPSDEALQTDIGWAKAFGFNGVRKHQKIEDPRWLYWCDRLGVMVWEEMPNAREWSLQAEEKLSAEWQRAVRRDYNHPCIIAWVPVNESWGVPDLDRSSQQRDFVHALYHLTRALDPTRPVIANDGWQHARIDAEPHVLRLLAFARVGADAHRQHEIVHEHAVRALILTRIGRIGARREQPVVDLCGVCLVMRRLLTIARNQPADFVDARVA